MGLEANVLLISRSKNFAYGESEHVNIFYLAFLESS